MLAPGSGKSSNLANSFPAVDAMDCDSSLFRARCHVSARIKVASGRGTKKRGTSMVAAYHLMWSANGWWLPNDPRGSSSATIRVERIAELGELQFGRRIPQPDRKELSEFVLQARDTLAHSVFEFDEIEPTLLAESFAKVINEKIHVCYECAIMPDHVHRQIRRHRDFAETMIENLQTESKTRLIAAGRRPKPHPVWGGPGWKVFLNSQDEIVRIIEYIRQNPIKRGMPVQRWPFVVPYDGWLP